MPVDRSDPLSRVRVEIDRLLGPGPAKAPPRLRELCRRRASDDFREVVERSGLSQTEFAHRVLEVDESTVRGFLETGKSLSLLNLYMLRDEDAAAFIELYLKFLDERRNLRSERTGTHG